MLAFLLLAAVTARAEDIEAITVLERQRIPVERSAAAPTRALGLTLVYLQGAGWERAAIVSAVSQAGQILSQCGLALERAELLLVHAPARFRDFSTPVAREFARMLLLARPAVIFVAGTRQQPAFDAEAIGRGNSRTRPELADTVWVTHGTRDLGIALAHELVHVLMDSGAHSSDPGNLMREDTSPANKILTDEQCTHLRDTGVRNGLIRPY
jgi:hypothetical protein